MLCAKVSLPSMEGLGEGSAGSCCDWRGYLQVVKHRCIRPHLAPTHRGAGLADPLCYAVNPSDSAGLKCLRIRSMYTTEMMPIRMALTIVVVFNG